MASLASIEDRIAYLGGLLTRYSGDRVKELFPEIVEEASYALFGGKMLRGTLSLLVASMFTAQVEKVLPIALAVELMHAASLVHDDIADASPTRRGRPSFWSKYGLEDAITVPHVLMPVAISLVADAGVEAVKESMNAWRRSALGQLWDTRILRGREVPVGYEKLIEYKTAAVFEASCTLPLIAIGRRDIVESGRVYGRFFGLLYQVLDDFSDAERGVVDSGSTRLLLREASRSSGSLAEYVEGLAGRYFGMLVEVSGQLESSLVDFAYASMNAFAREAGEHVARVVRAITSGKHGVGKFQRT
ncbi:polyprenyl synthetase family protein [Thermofilum pendens]|uniref:Polyprenyl synthetase n=1 Tax=Thermofilum pendens (strain DSM 2475 / Hrk 5) TaxID=368408 RepID=A1RWE7_THEPD|nr:polyprenyl synthetase family protein [Thermofilum pendens]ABL77527.1 Polyprenyl synthetase [Thermofilum pendens Hrk 5]